MFPAGPKTPADTHARTAGASPDQHTAPGPAAQAPGLPIKLSATRQADVSDYQGKVYVNVREYYHTVLARLRKLDMSCYCILGMVSDKDCLACTFLVRSCMLVFI